MYGMCGCHSGAAKMANSLESSEFTSAYERLETEKAKMRAFLTAKDAKNAKMGSFLPVE